MDRLSRARHGDVGEVQGGQLGVGPVPSGGRGDGGDGGGRGWGEERGEKTLGAREETVDLTVDVVVSAVVVAMVVVVVVVVVVVEVVVVAKVELMDVFVVVLTEGEALDGLAVRAGGLGQPRGDGPGGWEGRHCFLVFLKPFTHLLVSSIQTETLRYL